MCRCGNSTKENLTSAWTTPSPARTPSSPASATIRRPTSSPAARLDLPNPAPLPARQDITNHGRNVAISETHIFSDRTINQISGGYNRIFNHILSFGDRSCEAAKLGIPGANLDSSCSGFPGGAPAGLSQSRQIVSAAA